MGMHLEARLSETLGFIDAEMVKEIRTLIESYALPTKPFPGNGILFCANK